MEHQALMNHRLTYSEILRVIGAYIDHEHLVDIRVLETADGMVLQGRQTLGEGAGLPATYQLTKDDIQILLADARAHRGRRIEMG